MEKRPHLIPCLVAATMLLLALLRWPYGYYVLLRLVVCLASVYLGVLFYSWRRIWAIWIFAGIALLFNPLIPVHLSRSTWQPIDVVTALVFVLAAAILCQPKTAEKEEPRLGSPPGP